MAPKNPASRPADVPATPLANKFFSRVRDSDPATLSAIVRVADNFRALVEGWIRLSNVGVIPTDTPAAGSEVLQKLRSAISLDAIMDFPKLQKKDAKMKHRENIDAWQKETAADIELIFAKFVPKND